MIKYNLLIIKILFGGKFLKSEKLSQPLALRSTVYARAVAVKLAPAEQKRTTFFFLLPFLLELEEEAEKQACPSDLAEHFLYVYA